MGSNQKFLKVLPFLTLVWNFQTQAQTCEQSYGHRAQSELQAIQSLAQMTQQYQQQNQRAGALFEGLRVSLQREGALAKREIFHFSEKMEKALRSIDLDPKSKVGSHEETKKTQKVDFGYRETGLLKGSGYAITSLSLTNDGRLISASDDMYVSIWKKESSGNWSSIRLRGDEKFGIRKARQLQNGDILSSAYNATAMKVWTEGPAGSFSHQELEGHSDTIRGFLELKNGLVASFADDGTLRLWKKQKNGSYTSRLVQGYRFQAEWDLFFQFADGRVLFARQEADSHLSYLIIWDPKAKGPAAFTELPDPVSDLRSLVLLKNGNFISTSQENSFRLWKPSRRGLFSSEVMKGHVGSLLSVTELVSGQWVSTALDRTLRLWTADKDGNFSSVELSTSPMEIDKVIALREGGFVSNLSQESFLKWIPDGLGGYKPISVSKNGKRSLEINKGLELPNGGLVLKEEFGDRQISILDPWTTETEAPDGN